MNVKHRNRVFQIILNPGEGPVSLWQNSGLTVDQFKHPGVATKLEGAPERAKLLFRPPAGAGAQGVFMAFDGDTSVPLSAFLNITPQSWYVGHGVCQLPAGALLPEVWTVVCWW